MKERYHIFIPLLVLSYFFVHYGLEFFYFITARDFIVPFLLYLAGTCLVIYIASFFFRNIKKFAAAFSSILFVGLFFGSLMDTAGIAYNGSPVKSLAIFVATFAILISIIYWLKPGAVKSVLLFWMVYSMMLMAYDVAKFFISVPPEKKYLTREDVRLYDTKFTQRPDIWFLLFDMYPSDTSLRNYLFFDNSKLSNHLRSHGFFVTGNASSLYRETFFSLASTLGQQRLVYVNDPEVPAFKKPLISLSNIGHSFIPKLLKNNGYEINNYSPFTLAGQPSPLSFNLDYHRDHLLTRSVVFSVVYDALEPDFVKAGRGLDVSWLKDSWSSQVLHDTRYLLQKSDELSSTQPGETPAFNYLHFMLPHPPMLFDSTGKLNDVRNMYSYTGYENSIQNFKNYIVYTNTVIKKIVDKILLATKGKAIIILQGDHGYREYQEKFPANMQLGTQNAVYLPGAHYSGFSDTTSPLQAFRLVIQKLSAPN